MTTRTHSVLAGYSRITQRDDRVYVTTDRELARACAGVWAPDDDRLGGGVLYQVEAIGELEPDEDLPGLDISFQVSAARVLAIIDGYVARNDAKYAKKVTEVLRRLQ